MDRDETIRRSVEVLNEAGLHARPAAVLAQCAQRFRADIALVLNSVPEDLGVEIGTSIDAKSVMEVLFLAAPQGTGLEIEATGPDAVEAVEALAAVFAERFGIE